MEVSLALLCWSPLPGLGQKRTIPVLCAIAADSGLTQPELGHLLYIGHLDRLIF